MDLSPRVRAVCDLDVSEVREYAGRHEYDGKPQDLSPAGVRAGLARLATARADGERLADGHDEAHLSAAEEQKRVAYAELELHRRNPILHLGELDLACYDKDYAPQEERDAARAEHLAAWPRVADAAIESLDQVSAPVAEALLGGIRGLAAGLTAGPGGSGQAALAAARAAHARLVVHTERAAAAGDPDPALGGAGLAALMSSAEASRLTWAGWPSRPMPNGTGCTPCSPTAAPGSNPGGPRSTWPAIWSGITPTAPG